MSGQTDELSKIFFPCKMLWSFNSILRQNAQNSKTVHQQGRAKHLSVTATVLQYVYPITSVTGRGDLINLMLRR
jgi:hypothetical protein